MARNFRPVLAAMAIVCAGTLPAASAPRGAPAPAAAPAQAFETPNGADLNEGKTPAEMFKQDCGVCHKSPAGLGKGGGLGLQSFLRQHYTTGTVQAGAMAAYLASVGQGGAPAKPTSPERPEPRGTASAPAAAPAAARRPAASEPAHDGLSKPAEQAARPAEPAPAKPAEAEKEKPEAKPAPARRQPARVQEAKPAEPKPVEAAPAPPAPTQTAEPAPAPVEPKPAAPAAPQIPL